MSKKLDSSSYRQWEEHRNNLDSSPTLQQFIKFLINRADLLETLTDTFKYKQNNKPNNNNDAFKTKNFLVSTDNTRAYSCPMCSQSHGLFNCPSFKALDIDSRIKKAKESRVCMNCLRLGHVENACTLTHCKYCKYRHNTLLHKDVNKNTYTNKSASVPTTSGLANNVALSSDISPSTLNNHGSVLLSTALVKVADRHGSLHTARLLLDNGSTSNFVTESLCEKLDLKRYNASSTVSVKAVHIELVSSLTKEAYLAALNRFMARRGRPQTIYSDHGVGLQRASPGPLPTHRIPAAALLEAILRRVRDLAPAEDEVAHVDGTPTSRIPCLGQGQDATPLDVAHGTDRPATSRQRRSQQSGRHRDQTRHNSTGLQQYLSSTLGLLNTSTAGSLLRLLKLATSVQEEERGERRHHV
ncbi:uncharacterized protein LOC119692681 isoform X2 [Plutella xylostella]|uniref:uncharacterized protein LOC119692681 isoform X2 n=1 Tax=Plutella xylostella TaxID=51655 RepID=UPI002032C1C3|nr:uncharacterized protein LOC119692681 isoform X2 [Plutella xylostella]